jgi:hypothetical protein
MADAGLFIGFGQPVRGREQQAVGVFNEAMQFYAGLKEQGQIEEFEAILLEPHGGELGGFFLMRGEAEKLASVRVSDDFQRLNARAGLIVENLGVVGAVLGGGIEQQMMLYQAQVTDLAATA